MKKYFWPLTLLVALFFTGFVLPARAELPIQPSALPSALPSAPSPFLMIENSTYTFPSPPAIAQAVAVNLPINEGFEGSWPGVGWVLNTGPYTWGQRACHPHSGQFAGWSVGGGATGAGLACSGSYPNNANVSARYGPFDLSDATSAQLSFFIWGKTQMSSRCQLDKVVALSSTDGVNFSGLTGCGDFTHGLDGNGYSRVTLDLNNQIGQPQVWVLFGMLADSAINDIGVTIDDIALNVAPSVPPTPAHTATPTRTPTATPTSTSTPTPSATPGPKQIDGQRHVFLPIILKHDAPLTPPTATSTTTPLPATSIYDGSWAGITQVGTPISFTIANRALTAINYEYDIQGCGIGVRTEFTIPQALIGNTFMVQNTLHQTFPLPPFTLYTVNVTINGTFSSATSATGTLQVNDGFCGTLNTTWSATKH